MQKHALGWGNLNPGRGKIARKGRLLRVIILIALGLAVGYLYIR